MKVLITGGAGFIGSHLARALLWQGYDVVAVDNFNFYYPRKCKEFNVDLIRLAAGNEPQWFSRDDLRDPFALLKQYFEKGFGSVVSSVGTFVFYEMDFADNDALAGVFGKHSFDAIVHLGAMGGVPYSTKDPRLYTEVNVVGTVNLLTLAKDQGVAKFLFASSSSVYGNREKEKVLETDDVTNAMSVYGASKVAGEVLCHAFHQIYGLKVGVIRIFGPVYGPLQRPYGMLHQRAINYVFNEKRLSIYGRNGLETAKDSTYIDDEVRGFLQCLQSDFDFEIFNLGTSHPLPIRVWFDAITKASGKEVLYDVVEVDKADVISSADIGKAREILGYEPQVSMEEGVRRQVEVFKTMPLWYQQMEKV